MAFVSVNGRSYQTTPLLTVFFLEKFISYTDFSSFFFPLMLDDGEYIIRKLKNDL